MIVRFYQGWFQVLVIDLPLFLASTCSISSFYLAAERALYPKTWKRTFLYLPFVMAVGIGLSVRNAVAVMEAIFGSEIANLCARRNIAWKQARKKASAWAKKSLPASAPAGCLSPKCCSDFILPRPSSTPFKMKITPPCPSCCFSSGATSTPASCPSAQTYLERLRFGVESGEVRPASTGAPGF